MTAPTMEYNYLGKSGLKVSKICLGTMTFGKLLFYQDDNPTEEAFHQMIDRYVELGGNFLDTADIYSRGQSEEIIGRWFEQRNNRENIVLATKVRRSMGLDKNINNVGLSRRHITASIDKSLKRLHTDYVDLYQIHCWDNAALTEEVLRTIDDLVRCGKVRYAGASNLFGWQMQKLIDAGKMMGLNPFVSLQQQYNLLSRWSELESFQVCKMEGLGVLPWSPLKGGILTGKFKRGSVPSEGRLAWAAQNEKLRSSEAFPGWSQFDSQTFDIVEAIERIAKVKGKSTAQVSLRWLLQKDIVSSVIIGATKMHQLEDNMGAATGWSLTPQEMNELDQLSAFKKPYPYRKTFFDDNRNNPFLPDHKVCNL